ncbi:MAG: phosphoglucomutase/phosphomannomutase family protein, partial [Omnitrophica bacterium]|nr:phosphoglucomutase/phosphomannomutase family protein [Candidatus Omnitrophota bacterium]
PERDGSVSFLLILEMLAYEGKSFDTLISEFYKQYGHYYYSRTAIPANRLKKSLESMKLPNKLYGKPIERVNTLDGIKLITKDNWLMFRKSGTEPIVRVYAESRSKKEGERLVALGKRMIYVL